MTFTTISDATRDAVVAHLDRHVRPHLSQDVSAYAPGRTRAWLEIEAPLGPYQPWKTGLHSEKLWPWLVKAWQKAYPTTVPHLGLSIYGDVGITWHRDATYACPPAMIVNLGPCILGIDHKRNSPRGNPQEPHFSLLRGGELVPLNVKHQHQIEDPDPDRWSIVLWRQKTYPPRDFPPNVIP